MLECHDWQIRGVGRFMLKPAFAAVWTLTPSPQDCGAPI